MPVEDACPHSVGSQRHAIQGVRDGNLAHQVDHENHSAAQDADEQQILAGIIVADLGSQLFDPFLEGFFIDQYFGNDFFVVLHGYFYL